MSAASPLTILHVITTINRGGAENHLFDLIAQQVSAGCRVACAYLKGDGYWGERLSAAGVEVFPLQLTRYGEFAPLSRLRRGIAAFGPDIVHAHLGPAELYARAALIGDRRTTFVVSRHNEYTFTGGVLQRALGRWVLTRVARMICISESVRRVYLSRGSTPGRTAVVRYGIDTAPYGRVSAEDIGRIREQWEIPPKTVLLGTVARMVPAKALHVMLEGFATFLRGRNGGPEVKLALVGGGPLEPELRAHAQRLGLTDHLIWAGMRQDIPAVMQALDLFVLTSVTEGFGLVLLEAMCAGKAVIASDISAIPEIVVDGVTGLLIPPREPQALAAAIERLVADPAARERLGGAGRHRAASDFTLATMGEKTLAVYRAAQASPCY